MPLTAPDPPERQPATARARAAAVSATAASAAASATAATATRAEPRAGATAQGTTAGILCLGLSVTLESGQADRLADAVLDRVVRPGRPVGTVILDVRAGTGLDSQSRAILVGLQQMLASMGTRLRIVTSCRRLADRLREAGLAEHLGPGEIHDSVRSAVLATYASLPGPGVVTPQVRAALDIPVEMVDPEPGGG
jgi:MFS superfamily sulfate permease-like transporter